LLPRRRILAFFMASQILGEILPCCLWKKNPQTVFTALFLRFQDALRLRQIHVWPGFT